MDLGDRCVLVHGARAPRVVTRAQLSLMKHQAVLVDVSIDQGGCFETSRPTTHSNPTYEVDGITHYCVTNMPGAVRDHLDRRAHERHHSPHRACGHGGGAGRDRRKSRAEAGGERRRRSGDVRRPWPRRSGCRGGVLVDDALGAAAAQSRASAAPALRLHTRSRSASCAHRRACSACSGFRARGPRAGRRSLAVSVVAGGCACTRPENAIPPPTSGT